MQEGESQSNETQSSFQTSVPSDFKQFLYVIRYEILKYLRSRRLIIILVILGLVIGLILVIPPAFGEDYPSDALEFASWFVAFSILVGTSIFVLLCATAFGSDAIVSEYQNKTGYLLFPNPVKKGVIFFGKFAASLLASIVIISLFYLILVISVLITSHYIPGEVGLSFLFHLLYMATALSIAYLISSIMKGTTGAMVLTFFLFFLILPIFDSVFTFAGVKPWPSITFSSGILLFILMKPYPVDTVEEFPIGDGQTFDLHIFYPEVALSVLVMVFYLVISFTLAYFIFLRKEMK